MEQHKFIHLAHTISGGMEQDENGNTTHHLRNNLDIIHNYKRNSLTMVIREEPKVECTIPNDIELERIYRLHATQTDILSTLREYADEWRAKNG